MAAEQLTRGMDPSIAPSGVQSDGLGTGPSKSRLQHNGLANAG